MDILDVCVYIYIYSLNHWLFVMPNVSSTPFVTLFLRSAIMSAYTCQKLQKLRRYTFLSAE
jgi:hypothetical protein